MLEEPAIRERLGQDRRGREGLDAARVRAADGVRAQEMVGGAREGRHRAEIARGHRDDHAPPTVRRLRRRAALASAVAHGHARASAAYPTKPVRLIVPFPPGGGTDNVGRILSMRLSEVWGQQMIIENRGGAGSNIGNEAVAQGDAGRLHHPVCRVPARDQQVHLSDDRLRSGRRLRADLADRHLPEHPGGAERLAGEVGQRADRFRQGQPRRHHLRLVRHRHLAAPEWRAVLAHGRVSR